MPVAKEQYVLEIYDVDKNRFNCVDGIDRAIAKVNRVNFLISLSIIGNDPFKDNTESEPKGRFISLFAKRHTAP